MSLNLPAIFGPETASAPSDRATDSVPLAAVEAEEKIAERFERGDIDIHDASPWDRPLDLSELARPDDDCDVEALSGHDFPGEQVGGLCSPPAKLLDHDRLGRVLTVCDRCQSKEYVDVPIHDGASTRRDCRRCRRFMGFTNWHGLGMDEETRAERCCHPRNTLSGDIIEHRERILESMPHKKQENQEDSQWD